jgi:hypothetical protein
MSGGGMREKRCREIIADLPANRIEGLFLALLLTVVSARPFC